MRPSGPVPVMSARLIPRSAARVLAMGEAITRSPAGRGPAGAAAGAPLEAGAGAAAALGAGAGAAPTEPAAAATVAMSALVQTICASVPCFCLRPCTFPLSMT
jgi:hypothetical protein